MAVVFNFSSHKGVNVGRTRVRCAAGRSYNTKKCPNVLLTQASLQLSHIETACLPSKCYSAALERWTVQVSLVTCCCTVVLLDLQFLWAMCTSHLPPSCQFVGQQQRTCLP
jgi:hypothetical protein